MNDEKRLLEIIINRYFDENGQFSNEIENIIDIIQKYPDYCYLLLTKGFLCKKERVKLLTTCLDYKDLLNNICESKTYIRKMSIEEQNLLLNNCDESKILTIVNACSNISKHIDKLKFKEPCKRIKPSTMQLVVIKGK